MNLTDTRRRQLLIAAPFLLVILVAAFLWFRPDALFTNRTVEEELDPALAAALNVDASATTRSAAPPSETSTGTGETSAPDATGSAAPTPASTEPEPAASDDTASASADEGPSGPVVLKQGEWTSLDHVTTGTVALVDDGGDLQLVLADLVTDNGPDLRVILSPQDISAGEVGDYEAGATYLGTLKGNQGTQVYDVPDDLDVDDIASAVIWCERFAVGFGAANLT